jgi:molybdopterin synthase catalytic subunit
MSFQITEAPLQTRPLREAVAHSGAGAILVFEGVTRDHFEGREVTRLEYEAYAPMAIQEMEAIGVELRERWPHARLAIAHRVGVVQVGEASVLIAVSAPHRASAYEASRFAIDSLKARVPIWKKELYADGSSWKANSESRGPI